MPILSIWKREKRHNRHLLQTSRTIPLSTHHWCLMVLTRAKLVSYDTDSADNYYNAIDQHKKSIINIIFRLLSTESKRILRSVGQGVATNSGLEGVKFKRITFYATTSASGRLFVFKNGRAANEEPRTIPVVNICEHLLTCFL